MADFIHMDPNCYSNMKHESMNATRSFRILMRLTC